MFSVPYTSQTEAVSITSNDDPLNVFSSHLKPCKYLKLRFYGVTGVGYYFICILENKNHGP